MIDSSFLQLLCCPETHQVLRGAPPELIGKLNERARSGVLRNRAGKSVTVPIEEGLVREDGKFLYPVRNNIPVLIIDEALPLSGAD